MLRYRDRLCHGSRQREKKTRYYYYYYYFSLFTLCANTQPLIILLSLFISFALRVSLWVCVCVSRCYILSLVFFYCCLTKREVFHSSHIIIFYVYTHHFVAKSREETLINWFDTWFDPLFFARAQRLVRSFVHSFIWNADKSIAGPGYNIYLLSYKTLKEIWMLARCCCCLFMRLAESDQYIIHTIILEIFKLSLEQNETLLFFFCCCIQSMKA